MTWKEILKQTEYNSQNYMSLYEEMKNYLGTKNTTGNQSAEWFLKNPKHEITKNIHAAIYWYCKDNATLDDTEGITSDTLTNIYRYLEKEGLYDKGRVSRIGAENAESMRLYNDLVDKYPFDDKDKPVKGKLVRNKRGTFSDQFSTREEKLL